MVNLSCLYVIQGILHFEDELWDSWIVNDRQPKTDEIAHKFKNFLMKSLNIGKKNIKNKRLVNIYISKSSPKTFNKTDILSSYYEEINKLPKNTKFSIYDI